MMKKSTLFGGIALAVLGSLSLSAHAAITSQVTLTFGVASNPATNPFPTAVFGLGNLAPVAGGGCQLGSGGSDCYYDQGVAVGTVYDPSNATGHLHRAGSSNIKVQYHADAPGIYIRATDGTAFSLEKMLFAAPFNDTFEPLNPNQPPSSYWEILGFNTAVNPTLSTGDGTNYPTRIAYQQVPNSATYDPLLLNSDFQNVNAVWIHYVGEPAVPTSGVEFAMTIDNVVLNAPTGVVPIPAAVWLFGSAITGVLAFARKKGA